MLSLLLSLLSATLLTVSCIMSRMRWTRYGANVRVRELGPLLLLRTPTAKLTVSPYDLRDGLDPNQLLISDPADPYRRSIVNLEPESPWKAVRVPRRDAQALRERLAQLGEQYHIDRELRSLPDSDV